MIDKLIGWCLIAISVVIMLVILTACTCDGGLRNMSDEWCEKSAPASASQPKEMLPAQSWDQANLKQGDNTCRTMIYHAPGGVLEQCDERRK